MNDKCEAVRLIQANAPNEWHDTLQSLLRPSYRMYLNKVAPDNIAIGQSRIGGVPDVPSGFVWPKWDAPHITRDVVGNSLPSTAGFLHFMAQINLADLPECDARSALPDQGQLYFFFDSEREPWGDVKDEGGWRVFYLDVNSAALERMKPPADFGHYALQLCSIQFEQEWTLPFSDSVHLGELLKADSDWKTYESTLDRLMPRKYENEPVHRILGHPQAIQGMVEVDAYWGNSGVRMKLEEDVRTYWEDQYRLLLQLSSDPDSHGWMWGDGGCLYYCVQRSDFERAVFNKSWLVLQSG